MPPLDIRPDARGKTGNRPAPVTPGSTFPTTSTQPYPSFPYFPPPYPYFPPIGYSTPDASHRHQQYTPRTQDSHPSSDIDDFADPTLFPWVQVFWNP